MAAILVTEERRKRAGAIAARGFRGVRVPRGAIIPEAHPDNRYMWSWQPESPWLGYKEGPHQTGSLPTTDMQSLFKVGRTLLGIQFRGRIEGTGRFEGVEDFERAVFAAVNKLLARKRRPTQEAIGAYLIAKRGRNKHAGDSPADPGRQFRAWCTRFKCNPGDLIQRAIAACDNGE